MLGRAKFVILLCLFFFIQSSCQNQSLNPRLRSPKAVVFSPVKSKLIPRSMRQLAREVNIKPQIMSSRSLARRKAKRIKPTFLTIHSTANRKPTASAMQHSRALKNGAFRDRSWHFTVDRYMSVQHLPLNESAWHAGTRAGNMNSIGIEMCENESRGHNHFHTWNRSAKLTALLMKRFNIPLRRVVPHYHWYGKSCPGPLLDGGRPGRKWAWFHARVDYYYRCINNGVPNR